MTKTEETIKSFVETQGEPVAWRLRKDGEDYGVTSYDREQASDYMKDGWVLVQELFARPAAQADEVRKLAGELMDGYLNDARERAHPCDQNNDDAVAELLPPLMQSLYRALRTTAADNQKG